MWNVYVPLTPPTMLRWVRTVTVSPGVNDLLGRNEPPRPSESPLTTPAWPPLREPVTAIPVSWLGGTPRNVICVCGAATCPFGIGNVLTAGAAATAEAVLARAVTMPARQ